MYEKSQVNFYLRPPKCIKSPLGGYGQKCADNGILWTDSVGLALIWWIVCVGGLGCEIGKCFHFMLHQTIENIF